LTDLWWDHWDKYHPYPQSPTNASGTSSHAASKSK